MMFLLTLLHAVLGLVAGFGPPQRPNATTIAASSAAHEAPKVLVAAADGAPSPGAPPTERAAGVDPCPFYVSFFQVPGSLEPFRTVVPTGAVRVRYGNQQENPPPFCLEQDIAPESIRLYTLDGFGNRAPITSQFTIYDTLSNTGRPHWEASADLEFPGTISLVAELDAYGPSGWQTHTATGSVTVARRPRWDVSITPTAVPASADAGAQVQLQYTVQNTGSLTSTVEITCTPEAGGSCVSVSPSAPTLASLAQTTVTVTVAIPTTTHEARYAIQARSLPTVPVWYNPEATARIAIPTRPLDVTSLRYMGGDRIDRARCPIVGAGPGSVVQCGDLLFAHALPAYRTRNKPRSLTLLYNSATADVRPTVVVDHRTEPGQSATAFRVEVWRVVGATSVPLDTVYFDDAGATSAAHQVRRFVVPIDVAAAALGTGAYPIRARVTRYWSGGSDTSASVFGTLLVVDRRNSPWGAGWWPEGVDRLHPGQDGGHVLHVGADGSATLFRAAGTQFVAPAGEHSTLTRLADGSYRRVLPGDRVHVFYDSLGLVRRVWQREPATVESRYHWSAGGPYGWQLDSITDAAGFRTRMTMGSGGRVASLATPNGLVTTLQHVTASGGRLLLQGITDPDGHVTTLGYDASSARLTSSDTRGTDAFAYTYDEVGRVARVDAPGADTTNDRRYRSWQQAGAPTAARPGTSLASTAPAARADTVSFSTWQVFRIASNQFGESRATFRLHHTGSPSLVALPGGNSTYFVRDSAGQATIIRTMSGGYVEQQWDTAGNLVRAIQRVHGNWLNATLVRDDTTTYEYHPQWQSVTRITPPRASEAVVIGYDQYGRRDSVRDGRGNTTRFTYTSDGLPATVDQPLSDDVTYSYHSTSRNLTSQSQSARTTTYGYAPNLVDLVSTSDGTSTSLVQYDSVRRVVRSETGAQVMQYAFDDALRTTTQTDPRGRTTVWTSDALGRPVSECRVSGCLSTTYDGPLATGSARDGAFVQSMAYDGFGRLVSRWNQQETVRFDYDGVGNAVSVTNWMQGAQLVDSGHVPENVLRRPAIVERRYDAYGRVTCEQHRLQDIRDTTHFSGIGGWTDYDRMGRPARVFLGRAAGCVQRFEPIAAMDDLDPLNPANWATVVPVPLPTGQFLSAADSVSYAYDNVGNLASLVYAPWSAGYTGGAEWSFAYDAENRLSGRTSPSASLQSTSVTYDGYGDIADYTATGAGGVATSVILRDLAGRPTRKTTGGVQTDYEYDATRRLTKENRVGAPHPDELVYDAAGNILKRGPTYYTYGDGTNGSPWDDGRLLVQTDTVSGLSTYFAYDRMGNQLRSGSQSFVQQSGLMAAGDRAQTFDASNRLRTSRLAVAQTATATCPGTIREEERIFEYDGLGRRVLEVSLTRCAHDYGVTRYFWLGNHVVAKTHNLLLDVLQPSDTLLVTVAADANAPVVGGIGQWYVLGPGTDNVLGVRNGNLGVTWSGIQANTRYLMVQDERGSVVRSVCEPRGGGTCSGPASGGFTAFGQATSSPTPGASSLPGFNGQQATAGLVYMRNRWYDPNTGRFTQEDPIGYAGGSNLYAYAGNDPVTFSDPFGLCPDSLVQKDGECKGGLTKDEWWKVEYAARNRMTPEARDRVLGLLYAGRIHSGLTFDQRVAHPGADAVAERGGGIFLTQKAFEKLKIGDFAFLVAHESQHVYQGFFMSGDERERDADAYGCANTWGRILGFAGAYRELGPCGATP